MVHILKIKVPITTNHNNSPYSIVGYCAPLVRERSSVRIRVWATLFTLLSFGQSLVRILFVEEFKVNWFIEFRNMTTKSVSLVTQIREFQHLCLASHRITR